MISRIHAFVLPQGLPDYASPYLVKPNPKSFFSFEENTNICMQTICITAFLALCSCEHNSPWPIERQHNPRLSDEHEDGWGACGHAWCCYICRTATGSQCHSNHPMCHSIREKNSTCRWHKSAHHCYHRYQSNLLLKVPSWGNSSAAPVPVPPLSRNPWRYRMMSHWRSCRKKSLLRRGWTA